VFTIASIRAPSRTVRFYRFYDGPPPRIVGYHFRVVCIVEEEPEALRIVDGLEQRRLRAKWRRRDAA
jgi:hypothetical protein